MWSPIGFGRKQKYELPKLIDHRMRETRSRDPSDHIVCDIDKTYLETEFGTWIQIARTALEDPEAKVTVAGASELLTALRWDSCDEHKGPRPLHFVSSSPPQMRAKLEEKMLLDGIDWSSDTFKNQAYNILSGRVDLLRHHVAYKSAAILALMQAAGDGSRFHLIGDDVESDAYIYLGIYLLTGGLISSSDYVRYLSFAGVDDSVANALAAQLSTPNDHQSNFAKVASIAIRRTKDQTGFDQPPLTDHVFLFSSFLELSLYHGAGGLVCDHSMAKIVRAFNNQHGYSARDIVSIFDGTLLESRVPIEKSPVTTGVIDRLRSSAARQPNPVTGGITSQVPRGLKTFGMNSSVLAAIDKGDLLEQCRLWAGRLSEMRRHKK